MTNVYVGMRHALVILFLHRTLNFLRTACVKLMKRRKDTEADKRDSTTKNQINRNVSMLKNKAFIIFA